jgi:hypothetical protein
MPAEGTAVTVVWWGHGEPFVAAPNPTTVYQAVRIDERARQHIIREFDII